MRLVDGIVRNYRSVKDASIDLSTGCKVLVGINESGKTNILKALSLLSRKNEPHPNDVRIPLPSEDYDEDSFITFNMVLDEKDHTNIARDLAKKVIAGNIENIRVSYNDKNCSLKEYISQITYIRIVINVKDGSRTVDYKHFDHIVNDSSISHILRGIPKGVTAKTIKEERIQIANYALLTRDFFNELPEQHLSSSSTQTPEIIHSFLREWIENNVPDVTVWRYDDTLTLPAELVLSTFFSNPSSCVPVKNMFRLAGVTNIEESISAAQKAGTNRYQSLLDRVGQKASDHINSVWRENEYQIKINLTNLVDSIAISIQDAHNKFDFTQRSDGFKRFVSFLLIISTQSKLNDLSNALILIDEPEIGLHPSGTKLLNDELFRIGKTNTVVYSTHSIFMVDRDHVENHYIVKKKNETTNVLPVDETNVFDEEVLYQSLKTSVFSVLNKKNIIFEGSRDKILFNAAVKSPPPGSKIALGKFKSYGIAHAEGTSSMSPIATLFQSADRNLYIISDRDEAATRAKEKHLEHEMHGEWLTYSDIFPDVTAEVGEDFVSHNKISFAIRHCSDEFPALSDFDHEQFLKESKKYKFIQNHINKKNLPKESRKPLMKKLKTEIFRNIESKHIEKEYFTMLKLFSENLQ